MAHESDVAGEFVLEQTLFQEHGVWFYQVPPGQVTTLSPRADSWDPEHPFLTGSVQIVQRGDACVLKLFEPLTAADDSADSDSLSTAARRTLFAQCPIEITKELGLDVYVQDCVDSSRYFMVRVEDEETKRRAYVGIGFPERASAFNFKASLQDHAKYALRQIEAAALNDSAGSSAASVVANGIDSTTAASPTKSQAFSLPEGQTMRINLKLNNAANNTSDGSSDRQQRRRSCSGGDGKVPLIPPPPGDLTPSSSTATSAADVDAVTVKAAQTQAASVVADDGEDWGDFTSARTQRPQQPEQQLKNDLACVPARRADDCEHGQGAEDSDGRMIHVAIRCRGRRRRRDEQRAAHANGTLLRPRRRADGLRAASDSSLSDSESDSDALGNDSSSSGVLEFSTARHGQLTHATPSVSVQTHASSGAKRRFAFDYVFPPTATQRNVYVVSVQQQVEHVLQAHARNSAPTHATIVAYGQTGTGKTYTMGMLTSVHDEVERGVIPRAVAQIIEYADRHNSYTHEPVPAATSKQHSQYRRASDGGNSARTIIVTMSYLQIYLETVQDLLVSPVDSASTAGTGSDRGVRHGRSGDLPVRQKPNQTFYVEGLSEYAVASLDDVHALLETAAQNRVLAATTRNKTSSRSHTLLTLTLKWSTRRSRQRDYASADTSSISSGSSSSRSEQSNSSRSDNDADTDDAAYSISFVDLAGSERVDGTLHFLSATRRRQELRMREAKFINRSLSALGSVIGALAQRPSVPTKRSTTQRHVRYRDSQLTKLLMARLQRDSGRLVLIATIDDERANVLETLSTLKFASQCRRVELQRPALSAVARRNDALLLEQAVREMKTTFDAREAALHREYQSRIAALEAQLERVTRTRDGAAQHVTYTALCALADQMLSSEQQQSPHQHRSIASFETEHALAAYVSALSERISATIRASTGAPSVVVQPKHSNLDTSRDVQQQPPPLASSPSELQASETVAPSTRMLTVASTPVAADAATTRHEPPSQQSYKLLPEHEREFSAVARWLLGSPDRLCGFHVDVISSELLNVSFSQIDNTHSPT